MQLVFSVRRQKKHGGEVEKGSFPARAQRAAAKNENKNNQNWRNIIAEKRAIASYR